MIRVFVVMLLLGAAAPVFAQSPTDDGIRIGGFIGANKAWVAAAPAPAKTASKEWTSGGATVDIQLSSHLSIDARAMYQRKGAKLSLVANAISQDVSADYISGPVLLKLRSSGDVRAYVMGGPEFSYRLRSKMITALGAQRVTEDAKGLTRDLEIAAAAGGGIERNVGRSWLFVEGLYAHGVTNVLAKSLTGETMRTRTVTLLAGLRF